MALTSDDIADLVIASQKDLGRMKFTDLTGDLQEYVAMPQLLKKERVEFKSGQGIQWNVAVDDNGQARNVGLYETDNYNRNDVLKTASIPWRHTNTNYSIDEHEITMNSDGPNKVLDLVKLGRITALVSKAKLMETDFWGSPTNSSDTVKPFGIDYWVVKNATTGFNGGNHSGFSAGPGGLSSSTYTRWKNYTAEYVGITKADLIAKWREAATKTMFKPPVDMPQYDKGTRYGYYTNYDVLGKLETLLEDQNENLGNDLASKDGSVVFRRTPVTWVPELDSDTQDPIYGINWGVFHACFLSGWFMKESKPRQAPNQHNVTVVDIDTTYNWRCTDRRKLFILNIA